MSIHRNSFHILHIVNLVTDVHLSFTGFSEPFWDQNVFFRAITTYDFDLVVWEYSQKVLTVCTDALIYGLHHFGGDSGPLLMKYDILGHFAGPKRGFSGPSYI